MPCWRRWCASQSRSWGRRSTAHCGRLAVPPRRAAACDVSVQACPGAGRGLWHAAARAATRASRPYRRDTRKPIRRTIAESQPELLAHHYTEAGLIEKAAGLWGKAGQQSLARSALVEAAEQLTRALAQIAALPATPALRREQIKLQVALTNALCTPKAMRRPKPKAALDQARSLIEQAEALGEPPKIRCCCSRSSTVSGSRIS